MNERDQVLQTKSENYEKYDAGAPQSGKYYGKCIVRGCVGKRKDDHEIRMFKFPTDSQILKIWKSKLYMEDDVVIKKKAKVCSRHFEKDSYGKKLNNGAIPTKFLYKPIENKSKVLQNPASEHLPNAHRKRTYEVHKENNNDSRWAEFENLKKFAEMRRLLKNLTAVGKDTITHNPKDSKNVKPPPTPNSKLTCTNQPMEVSPPPDTCTESKRLSLLKFDILLHNNPHIAMQTFQDRQNIIEKFVNTTTLTHTEIGVAVRVLLEYVSHLPGDSTDLESTSNNEKMPLTDAIEKPNIRCIKITGQQPHLSQEQQQSEKQLLQPQEAQVLQRAAINDTGYQLQVAAPSSTPSTVSARLSALSNLVNNKSCTNILSPDQPPLKKSAQDSIGIFYTKPPLTPNAGAALPANTEIKHVRAISSLLRVGTSVIIRKVPTKKGIVANPSTAPANVSAPSIVGRLLPLTRNPICSGSGTTPASSSTITTISLEEPTTATDFGHTTLTVLQKPSMPKQMARKKTEAAATKMIVISKEMQPVECILSDDDTSTAANIVIKEEMEEEFISGS